MGSMGNGKIKSFPLQFIEMNNELILKRGCSEIRISGENSIEVIRLILREVSQEGSVEKILEMFTPSEKPQIEKLLEELIARRFLKVTETCTPQENVNESSLDIFYWNFGTTSLQVSQDINALQFLILGVNAVSRQLTLGLLETGVTNIKVIDDQFFRNTRFFGIGNKPLLEQWPSSVPIHESLGIEINSESIHCIVATSDFGGRQGFSQWNSFCVQNGISFFPVILKNLIGFVGPLIIPNETACFDCLLARQDSNMENLDTYRRIEATAFEGQKTIGFHPSMASMVGSIATMELLKFYSKYLPSANVGKLIEVNLIGPKISVRKILKVPRCHSCSPLKTQSSTSLVKNVFAPINELQR